MEKASGTYLTITDNSIVSNGSTALRGFVPMLTVKGELGINTVTAETLEKVLGYDLEFNPDYYGLKTMLESVSMLKVLRINQNAKIMNAYFDNSGAKQTKPDATDTSVFRDNMLSVFGLTVGDWAGKDKKIVVKLAPTPSTEQIVNDGPTQLEPQEIVFSDISQTEKKTLGDVEYYSGCVFYNSSNNSIVGIIKENAENVKKVYRVVDNTIDDDILNPDGTIATDRSVGSAVWNDTELTITLTKKMSSDTFWYVRKIPTLIEDWTITFGVQSLDDSVVILNSYDFSTNNKSEIYWKNVSFGDYGIDVMSTISSSNTIIRDWFSLDSGSNGDKVINALDLDLKPIDKSKCNMCFMNGLSDPAIVARFATKNESLKIKTFVDAPAYDQYAKIQQWRKKVPASKYIIIGSVPDVVDAEKKIYLWPSASYCKIYANMMNTYGSLNYPPAGLTYGSISASNLLDTDFEYYADELKTDRINWQRTMDEGSIMWEQRTTYGLDSDLSYIAPVFIVDDLSDKIVKLERNYNFRYMSSTDLLNQQSGLKSILDDFQTKGFIYDYTLKFPTFAEAQKAGRTVDVYIKIHISKDSEVININLTLEA